MSVSLVLRLFWTGSQRASTVSISSSSAHRTTRPTSSAASTRTRAAKLQRPTKSFWSWVNTSITTLLWRRSRQEAGTKRADYYQELTSSNKLSSDKLKKDPANTTIEFGEYIKNVLWLRSLPHAHMVNLDPTHPSRPRRG